LSSDSQAEGRFPISFGYGITCTALPDLGADENILPRSVLEALESKGSFLPMRTLKGPIVFELAVKGEGMATEVKQQAQLTVELQLSAGPLRLRNVQWLVVEQEMDEVLLGRPLLNELGIDAPTHLASVRDMFQDLDCSKIPSVEAGGKLSRLLVRKEAVRTADMEPKQSLFCEKAETQRPIGGSALSRLDAVPANNKEPYSVPWAQANTEFQVSSSSKPSLTIPLAVPNASTIHQHSGVTHGDLDVDPIELPHVLELQSDKPDTAHDVVDALDALIERAKENGVPSPILKELRQLVYEFLDIWRISLSGDPPAKLPPLEVQLRPEASPVRVKLRRYPPAQRKFLEICG
jgi:hypothetical protein